MRRDNAGNYLNGLIAAARRLRALGYPWPSRVSLLARLGGAAHGAEGYLLQHRLSPSTDVNQNDALGQAFEAFGLDAKDEEHWRLLLALFAEAYFRPRRPRGGPKQWDDDRLFRLLVDFAAVKKNHPDESDKKICERIKKNKKFGKRYARVSAKTIRRRLQDARNPARNSVLKDILSARPDGMTAEDWCAGVIERIAQRWKNR
jgi:hypothetical protein